MIEIREYTSKCQISRRCIFLLTPAVNQRLFILFSFYCMQICLDTRRIGLGTYPCYSKVKPCSFMCSMEPKRLVNDLPFVFCFTNWTYFHSTLLVTWIDYPSVMLSCFYVPYTVWHFRSLIYFFLCSFWLPGSLIDDSSKLTNMQLTADHSCVCNANTTFPVLWW